MSNELVPSQGNYLSTNDDFYAALSAEAAQLKGGGNVLFMKFSGNDGSYSYGANESELVDGELLAMNPRSYKRGWICWVGGEPAAEIMFGLDEGFPPKKGQIDSDPQYDHGPYGKDDGWVEQLTVEFALTSEPYSTLLFQANNASKRRALGALLKDFANTYKAHPGEFPIVEIGSTSFDAKDPENPKRKYKKYAPTFRITDWRSEADLMALLEGVEGDYADDGYDEAPAEEVYDDTAPAEEVYDEAPAEEVYDAEPEYVEEPEPAPEPARRPAPRPAAAAPAPAQRPAPRPAPAPAQAQARPAPRPAAPAPANAQRQAAPAPAPAAGGARPAPQRRSRF